MNPPLGMRASRASEYGLNNPRFPFRADKMDSLMRPLHVLSRSLLGVQPWSIRCAETSPKLVNNVPPAASVNIFDTMLASFGHELDSGGPSGAWGRRFSQGGQGRALEARAWLTSSIVCPLGLFNGSFPPAETSRTSCRADRRCC